MRNSTASVCLLLGFAGFCVASRVVAAKPTIAVMGLESINSSPGNAEVVTEMLRNAIVRAGAFVVVEKEYFGRSGKSMSQEFSSPPL